MINHCEWNRKDYLTHRRRYWNNHSSEPPHSLREFHWAKQQSQTSPYVFQLHVLCKQEWHSFSTSLIHLNPVFGQRFLIANILGNETSFVLEIWRLRIWPPKIRLVPILFVPDEFWRQAEITVISCYFYRYWQKIDSVMIITNNISVKFCFVFYSVLFCNFIVLFLSHGWMDGSVTYYMIFSYLHCLELKCTSM